MKVNIIAQLKFKMPQSSMLAIIPWGLSPKVNKNILLIQLVCKAVTKNIQPIEDLGIEWLFLCNLNLNSINQSIINQNIEF